MLQLRKSILSISRRGVSVEAQVKPLRLMWILILCLSTACASVPQPVADVPLEQALNQRGISPESVLMPFELDDEMARWAHRAAPAELPPSERLEALAEALLSNGEMALEYSWGFTGTARQVFETRRANCLAFTNLFVAMARQVGVPVYFLAVETETYRRQGDFVVISDHIAVGHGPGPAIQMYDFSQRQSDELRRVRRIDDLTALAMFHSNRGAEALQREQWKEALDSLRLAVRLQPELATGWVNLGVARRRVGDYQGAELAYRRALEIDPVVYASYQNLISLLRFRGRYGEAEDLAAALQRAPHQNPFTYLSLGDISLRSGRLAEARRLYKRAVNLNREQAESYAALGQLAVVRGDLDTAKRMLRKARRLDDDNARTLRLASMIRPLGS